MTSKRAFFLIGLITLSTMLLYVRSRFLVVELSYVLSEKMDEKRELENQKRALTLELEMLKSPKRIERLAASKLGLSRDAKNAYVLNVSDGELKGSNP